MVLETAARVETVIRAAELPLVLGGDCTVGIGTVAGAVGAGHRVGLVYLDRHADLNTPESVPDGTLDWMGMSQMLDARGSIEPIAGAFAGRPLLQPSRVVILGADEEAWTAWEREEAGRLRLPRIGIDAVCEDPGSAQRQTPSAGSTVAMPSTCISTWTCSTSSTRRIPRTSTATRDPAWRRRRRALEVLCSDPRFAGLTVTEVNPAHASSDDPELRRLAGVLCDACRWASARSS